MTVTTGNPPTVAKILEEARRRIEVNDDELDEARDRRDKLRRVLEKEFAGSETYVNGSVAHGDALTPLTDVDVGVVVAEAADTHGPGKRGPRDLMDRAAQRIRDELAGDYKRLTVTVEGQKRAVLVRFGDPVTAGQTDFTADVIVAVDNCAGRGVFIPCGSGWDRSDPSIGHRWQVWTPRPFSEPAGPGALGAVTRAPVPTLVEDGLAVYATGDGRRVLLVPSPHGFVTGPTAASPLHGTLLALGVTVVTFDPPGAFASHRAARIDLDEMTGCCGEVLARLGVAGPVAVVGHSHASLCALHLALERPELVGRLLLVGAVAGGAAVSRADRGLPFSLSRRDRRFWRISWDGTRLAVRGDLATHKRLVNVFQTLSYADPALAPQLRVEPGDKSRLAPVRDRWQRRVRRVDLRPRLGEVAAPTLLCAGRLDLQTPLRGNAAVAAAIPGAEMVVFDHSGHYPFVEERDRFAAVAAPFLTPPSGSAGGPERDEGMPADEVP